MMVFLLIFGSLRDIGFLYFFGLLLYYGFLNTNGSLPLDGFLISHGSLLTSGFLPLPGSPSRLHSSDDWHIALKVSFRSYLTVLVNLQG